MKKTIGKTALTLVAAVVLTLLLAVSTAVPALAAETADTTTVSNPQIVYDEPDLGEDDTSDNGITLPEAPAKEGYAFQGWRVNGGGDLYSAGDVVVKDGSEEIHLQPVYEVDTGTTVDNRRARPVERVQRWLRYCLAVRSRQHPDFAGC